MSYSTIAAAFDDGVFSEEFHFANGYGSAPYIWDLLCDKYQIQGNFLNRWENLIKYHQDGNKMEPWEENCLEVTYDNTVAYADDLLIIAESMRRFVELVPNTIPNRICTLPAQAKVLEELAARGARFLAWNHTSANEKWWFMLGERLNEDETVPYNPLKENKHRIAMIKPLPKEFPHAQ